MSDWEVASEVPAPKAEGNAWEIASEAPAPHEKGFMEKIGDFLNPKYKSVLEGINAQPVQLAPKEAEKRDALIEQGKQILAKQEADKKAEREQLRQDAAKEKYTAGLAAKDIGLSVAKAIPTTLGVGLGLGEAATGWLPQGEDVNPLHLADWTGLHKKLQSMGASPTQASEALAGFQSKTLQNENANIKDTDNLWDAAKASASNPTALINGLVENFPGMLVSGYGGAKVVNGLAGRALNEARLMGLTGEKATQYAVDKVGNGFKKAIAVASGEGGYEAGNLANMASENGADWNNYIAPVIASGIATTVIAGVTGEISAKYGVGNIEQSIARRGLDKELTQGAAGRFGVGTGVKNLLLEPGLESLEEGAQAVPQQIAQNIALGKPWDQDVGQNVGQSAIQGAAMSGAHAGATRAYDTVVKPAVGNVTPISAGPTDEQLNALAKNQNIPESQYGQFRDAVRNQITQKLSARNQEAPTIVSPLRQPLTSPAQGSMFQQETAQGEPAPVYSNQESLNLPSEITDEETGEVHVLNPQQQAELNKTTQDLIQKRNTEPNRALAIAQTRMLAQIRENPDVTGPNAPTVGTGISTPQQSVGQVAPTQGATGAERNGVVSNQQNAPVPPSGEGQQPAPVTTTPLQATPNLTTATAPAPTVTAPVPQQNKPAIEPLPKDEFDEQIAHLREALKPYEHLEHGQMTPGQQQQFKNINAEIVRLGLNQGLTRTEAYDLAYAKPEQKQATTWEIAKEEPASTATPVVEEEPAEEAQPTRDMSKPVETPQGQVEPNDLYDANEFSDEIEPEFHAHVADSAAAVDAQEADPKAAIEAAKQERNTARMNLQNVESLYKNPDIEAQATKEQVDEARKGLEAAQAKLDAAEQRAADIAAAQKQAGRQRAEGGGRKTAELTPEQQANKTKIELEQKKRNAAVERARRAINKSELQLQEALEPLTSEQMADPQGQAWHEHEKEGKFDQAAIALQSIIENPILNGTPIKAKARDVLKQYGVTKEDIQRARAKKETANSTLEDQLNRKPDLFKGQNTYKGLLSSASNIAPVLGKPISAFNDNFTANAAISTIMKHGDAVQRYFANHIRGFVRDVKFVVIEKGDKLPAQLQKYQTDWDESRGLFIPETGDKTIYIRGSSFGENRGNDVITVLHELLHAAGMERIIVGVKNIDKDTKLTKAVLDIASIRERARTVYEDMVKRNVQSKEFKKLKALIEEVPDILFDDELTHGVAQGLDEFLAYSLTQPEMQTFLKAMPADARHFSDSIFSRFVRGFMDALAIDSGKPAWRSAMTDLVLATNKLLNAKYSKLESEFAGDVRKSAQIGGPPSREDRMELTKVKAELNGAKTDAQKIAYLENEKRTLDRELAKGDNGRFGPAWAQGIGRGNMTAGQALENRSTLAINHVTELQNHYDEVINSIRSQQPAQGELFPVRSSVKRDTQTTDMFGNDSTDEATQIKQRVKEKSAEIEARNKKPQSYLEKRLAARAAEEKAKLPPWHEAEQEGIKIAKAAYKDIEETDFNKDKLDSYRQALTDSLTASKTDPSFFEIGLEAFDDELYRLLEEDAKTRARNDASTAFDQRGSYDYGGNLELAADSYRWNIGDTLYEKGYRDYNRFDRLLRKATDAFDAQLEEEKKKLPRPLEGPRGLAPRRAAIRKAKVQEEKVTRGLEAVRLSENGPELGDATQNLQKERDPRNYVEQIVSLASDPLNQLIAFTWDVDALGRNGTRLGLPGLQDVYTNMQLMNGTTQKRLASVANEIEALQNFFWSNPDKKKTFTDLVNASTFDRYDPSNPKGKYSPTYDTMYKQLGADGQQAYKRLKDFYRDLNDEKQQLLKEQVDKLDLQPEDRKKVAAALREAYEGSDKIDPYFPLMRFGDYVLELGSGTKKISYRFESAHEREKAAAILANRVGKSIAQLEQDGEMSRKNDVNSSQMRSDVMNASKLLKSISEAVNNTPTLNNNNYKAELLDKVYQTYLSFMPEQSVRKQFMHRKDIPGFSTDLIRVLGSHGVKSARQIARLEHGQDIRNALGIAHRQLEGNPGATPYYNKMSSYVDMMVNPPVKSKVMKNIEIGSSWLASATHLHSLTSWASAFVQPVDIFVRGLPIIGAEFGYKNAAAELARMMQITSKYGVTETLPDGTKRMRMPSVSYAQGLTADEKYAVKAMEASGVMKDTMASIAYEGANAPSSIQAIQKIKGSKTWNKSKDAVNNIILGGLMNHTERLSREYLYMAAFNCGMKELNKSAPNMPLDEKRKRAASQAISKTFETFGNYADYNKPGFFRHPVVRLPLMFKFYPYVMYKTMLGNLAKALPLMNKEGKATALKKVFGIMGAHFLVGGLNATPGFSLAMMVAGAAFKAFGKDPDAPDDMRDIDFETWYRTVYLPEHLGHTGLDKLLEYGPFGAAFSNRVSINNMISFGDKPNESVLQAGLEAFNAVPGAIVNYAKGANSLMHGDYEKGFEQLLPGSLSSILAANRIANEGLRTSNGDQIEGYEKGNVPVSTIAAQAVGFKPSEVLNQQAKDFKLQTAQQTISLERANLSAQLKDAYIKSMDFDKGPAYMERFDKQFDEILGKMNEFGERHPELAFDTPKDPKEINNMLNQAMQDKLNREMNAGVKLNEKNVRLLGESVDYMKEQQSKNSP